MNIFAILQKGEKHSLKDVIAHKNYAIKYLKILQWRASCPYLQQSKRRQCPDATSFPRAAPVLILSFFQPKVIADMSH